VAAALVMAGVRAVVRDRASQCACLDDLMGRLNTLLFGDLGGLGFMTMHLSLVDAVNGRLTWASAGHDPALIYDPATDAFIELKRGEIPLGVLDDAQYEQYVHDGLRHGQVITIGTDGVWEARNEAGEQFGKQRLREAIRAAATGSAGQVSAAILDRLTAFRCKARPSDDITFIVVKLNALTI
jgi:sigma-B regulation protein RsbU (phosphoserine phosphatase)